MADDGGRLPNLHFEDGTVVDGGAFLVSMDSSIDITPAAGPSQSSSGLNAYDDGAGELLSCVDRLGDQDSLDFGRTVPEEVRFAETPSLVVDSAEFTPGAIIPPTPPVTPEPEPQPEPQPEPEPEPPYTYVRAGLMNADGEHAPPCERKPAQTVGRRP